MVGSAGGRRTGNDPLVGDVLRFLVRSWVPGEHGSVDCRLVGATALHVATKQQVNPFIVEVPMILGSTPVPELTR